MFPHILPNVRYGNLINFQTPMISPTKELTADRNFMFKPLYERRIHQSKSGMLIKGINKSFITEHNKRKVKKNNKEEMYNFVSKKTQLVSIGISTEMSIKLSSKKKTNSMRILRNRCYRSPIKL